jgi:hypothetical protein
MSELEPKEERRKNHAGVVLPNELIEEGEEPFDEQLPQLSSAQVESLINVIRGDEPFARDSALIFLFHNLHYHYGEKSDYVGIALKKARDRSLYSSSIARRAIKTFAATTHQHLAQQLAEWEKFGMNPVRD